MKYTIIKDGRIYAVAQGDALSLAEAYSGCQIIEGEFQPTEYSWVNGNIAHTPQIKLDMRTYQPTPEELHAQADSEARTIRDSLLTRSDWTQLPDVPSETKEAWAAYRQALRDITKQTGYPYEINWPTVPK